MASQTSNLVPVKAADFLDQDPPLRNQNFVCLSFLSPEDVIKKKDVYFFENFVKHFSSEVSELYKLLIDKYPDEKDGLLNIRERYNHLFDTTNIQDEFNFFVNQNSAQLEKQYHEDNNFQTTIRGIKVRGVFDTMKEAEIRCQVLKRIDDKFNVYVAQVGCWCPWSPNPDDIENQEFSETQLNTLMKNYKENQAKKDEHYQERKRELQFLKTKENLDKADPWENEKISKKTDEDTSESTSESTTATVTEVTNEATTQEPVEYPTQDGTQGATQEVPQESVQDPSQETSSSP